MKKILSLTLAALMVVSMVPTAFAANVDYQNGTEVEYTGSRTTINEDGTASHNAEYTITVPALLAPGGSGTVTLAGYWPSDATVKVTADASVDMLNSINNADKKTLTVTFAGIELAGSNTATVTDNEAVSVSDILLLCSVPGLVSSTIMSSTTAKLVALVLLHLPPTPTSLATPMMVTMKKPTYSHSPCTVLMMALEAQITKPKRA